MMLFEVACMLVYVVTKLETCRLFAVVPCKVVSVSCLIVLVATADTMTSTASLSNMLMFLNMADAVKLHCILVSCLESSAQAQYGALVVGYYHAKL